MTQNLRRLLIRADAGPRIGVGHVMRCLAIAQAWSRLGGQVDFACSLLPATIKRRIEREGFEILDLPTTTPEIGFINEWLQNHKPCWLVLDGYRFDDDYQADLELHETRLLCLDDFGHASHYRAHALLNQNVYPPRWNDSASDSRVDRMTGSRHVLLRNEFARGRTKSQTYPRTSQTSPDYVWRFRPRQYDEQGIGRM